MEQATPSNNSKKILGVVVGIVTFALVSLGVQQLFFKPSFDKAIREAASELNKKCPIMIDQDTRLDSAQVLPEKVFQYHYTFVNLAKSELEVDTVRKYMEPGLIDNVKTNPDLKIYRDNGVTMAYHYQDKDGVFLLKISVTPEHYAKK